MEKRKLENQNASEVRKGVFKFLGYFFVLTGLLFLSVYLFFKSCAAQSNSINNDIAAYKATLNKQQILKSKIDTIYYQMSLLNTGKVKNDVFLGNYISKNIEDTRQIIGKDSAAEFRFYASLLNKTDDMMRLKNELIAIMDKEQLALKDLNECIGKITKVKNELSRDPTRSFQAK
ncbi:MAG: type VI secretion system transmembrane protein TssO [Chitinophagaceae bacterium]|jgi:hypothetical protein|nr:type VI secretion system transmembrane protein TssO [Chitinophagaceae bacterium]